MVALVYKPFYCISLLVFHCAICVGVSSTYFTIEMHHSGRFECIPTWQYPSGSVNFIDWVDTDKISIPKLHEMAKELGYIVVSACWYRVLAMDAISGIRILDKDSGILSMVEWIPIYGVLRYILRCVWYAVIDLCRKGMDMRME